MENRYLIFEQKEAEQIIAGIKEIKELLLKQQKENNTLKDRWLTHTEASSLLRISPRQLHKIKAWGEINFSQVGGKNFYKASDAEAYLEKHYSGKNKRYH